MNDDTIDIRGLDKAALLKALYDNARPQGMGLLSFVPKPMTAEEATATIAGAGERLYFDYVGGRVMKVDLGKDDFSPRLYDRDNGQGAAARVITQLRTEAA